MDEANEYRKNKLKSLKVGDTVYIVPYDKRNKPFTSTISSLGSKWLKVNNMNRSENSFNILEGYRHVDSTTGVSRYTIYASEEDIKECERLDSEMDELYKTIKSLQSQSNIETLKKVINKWNKLLNKQNHDS